MEEQNRQPKSWLRRNALALVSLACIIVGSYVFSAPLRQARTAAIEHDAIESARDIGVAEDTCRARMGRYVSIDELVRLGLLQADYIHTRARSAYDFRVDLEPDGESFLVHAIPKPSWIGQPRFFSIDELGQLRRNIEHEADRSVIAAPSH